MICNIDIANQSWLSLQSMLYIYIFGVGFGVAPPDILDDTRTSTRGTSNGRMIPTSFLYIEI